MSIVLYVSRYAILCFMYNNWLKQTITSTWQLVPFMQMPLLLQQQVIHFIISGISFQANFILLLYLVSMTISNAFLAPHDTSKLRTRSPSISSVSSVSTSTSSRLYPRPSISTSRTITSLAPSRSTVPRRKSSTSSTTSTTSTATTATSISSTQKGENVQVCVRCRPMTQHEFLNKTDHCWQVDPAASRIRLSENGLASRRQQGRQREHFYGKWDDPVLVSSCLPLS